MKENKIVIDKETALRAFWAERHEVSKILRSGEILTEEAAEILALIENPALLGSKFYGMNLDGLREISATAFVEILSGNPKNYLSLDGLTRLPVNLPSREVEVDEWEDPVLRVRHLCLNGLTELSEREIQFLNTVPVEHLELNSVISLPDKNCWSITGWRINQTYTSTFVELAGLREASCNILSNLVESVGIGGLNFNGLRDVTEDQIIILSRLGREYEDGGLWLGIEEFRSDKILDALAVMEVCELRLDRLVNLDNKAANKISEVYQGHELGLDGIKFIKEDTFKVLVTGNISGIPEGQMPGTLSLNSIQTLTQGMAKSLEGNGINLNLDGLTEIPIDIAQKLIHSKGRIRMRGLRVINDHVADVIAQNPSVFLFSRDVVVSEKARSILGESIPSVNSLSDFWGKLEGRYE
jgi:hypothetical protein